MGVDSRGKERGECQECDCSDYEVPDKGNRCSYCDCAPTKHQLNYASKSSTKGGTKGGTPAKTAASKDNSRNNSKSNSKAVLDSSQSDNAEQAAPKNKSWTARLKAGSPARAKVNAIARLSRPNSKGTQYSSQDEIPEKQAAPAKKSNWPSSGKVSAIARMTRPVSKDNTASSDDKPEPKKSAKDIRADFEVTALDQTPLDAEPEPVKQTPARNNSRPPPTRRGEQQRNQSPKDGGSGPMPPAGAKPRKKKSVAVKCHNLDQVMSSHLSDPSTRKRIDEMFTTFDDDASNELDREECKDLTGYILQQCGLQPDIIPAFVYDEAFDKYDDDGGGTITLDEFREFLNAFLESK